MQKEHSPMSFILRKVKLVDIPVLLGLYRQVALAGGLGRTADEVTISYIQDFVNKSLSRGLILALSPVTDTSRIIAEIHGYTLGLNTFAHVFEQVTMVVHPDMQGKGLGRLLLNELQSQVQATLPQIKKVELMCFGNNQRALNLYLHNGFEIEGRRKSRVHLPDGAFTDGIALAWFNPGYTGQ